MNSLSFDNMAPLYEQTRIIDSGCLNSALDYLAERFPPDNFGNIFYPGIGTGRIALPLAERGYRITGIDISTNMLELLEKRLKQIQHPLPISYHQADILNLPFPDAVFDMAVAVHLFYFIPDWKQAVNEILIVIGNNSPLVLMHTGSGLEIPFINERYRELCAELGFSIPYLGVKSTAEVVEYCETLGYSTEWIRDRWQWTQSIHLEKALSYVKARAYSFTTYAPDDIHLKAVEKLETELLQEYSTLTTEIPVPNQIYLIIVRK